MDPPVTSAVPMHWLDRYSNQYHSWRSVHTDHGTIFYRRQGIIESLFDNDGVEFGGRADLNLALTLKVKHRLTQHELRNKVILVWAIMRHHFALLHAKALDAGEVPQASDSNYDESARLWVYHVPRTLEEALASASTFCDFVEDYYPGINIPEFLHHAANAGRTFDGRRTQSRLFVISLPKASRKPGEAHGLTCLMNAGHAVADGLTTFIWTTHFTKLLNKPFDELHTILSDLLVIENIPSRLPPAQEDYYRPIPGNQARQRWFWAITRILRHVRTPQPACIQNPLARIPKREESPSVEPKFPHLLDYKPENKPPLSSKGLNIVLPDSSTQRIRRLCHDVGVSVGSGCFALAALAMMHLHERLDPSHRTATDEQLHHHRPVNLSFPINARPYTTYAGAINSLMLAFSPGISLPFLPSHLPLEGRFRLLALQADRQLRVYQKGVRGGRAQLLGSKSAAHLIPALYTGSMEGFGRTGMPAGLQSMNPQGAYPASKAPTLATCGVSSVGNVEPLIRDAKFDLEEFDKGKDLVATYEDRSVLVRVRVGEFLVGSMSYHGELRFGVSYDTTTLDEEKAQMWVDVMKGLMEEGKAARL